MLFELHVLILDKAYVIKDLTFYIHGLKNKLCCLEPKLNYKGSEISFYYAE